VARQAESIASFLGFLYTTRWVAIETPDDYQPVIQAPTGASTQERLHAATRPPCTTSTPCSGGVIDDLKRRKLLDSTLVIVTSDHGMEFDENGLASRDTVRPSVIISCIRLCWCTGREGAGARRSPYLHFDVVPTLLTELFGCTNPPSDYASGHSLFSGAQWDWLIANSHNDFALIEPNQVAIVYPSGTKIRDQNYRLAQNPQLSRDHLRAAMQEMRRFYGDAELRVLTSRHHLGRVWSMRRLPPHPRPGVMALLSAARALVAHSGSARGSPMRRSRREPIRRRPRMEPRLRSL